MPVLSTISQEKDEHGFLRSETYKTERDFEFAIEASAGGLYVIIPKSGGKAPKVCEERFTSHLKARDALIAYIKTTDHLGYAEYPGKPEAQKRKPKNVASTDE